MKIFRTAIAILIFGTIATFVHGQSSSVEIESFEVDGKKQTCDYSLELSFKNKTHKVEFEGTRFTIPVGLSTAKKIRMTFRCGNFELSFTKLRPIDFIYSGARYVWRIGVDHYPFEFSQVDESIAQRVKEVHYLAFLPDGYVGTRIQILVPMKKTTKR